MKNETLLLNTIQQLATKGSGFAIFRLSEAYYLQVSITNNDNKMWCEAVSNKYLDGANKLNDAKIQQLQALEWQAPTDSAVNFHQIYRVDSVTSCEALASLLWNTAYSVYGCNELLMHSVQLDLD